MKAGQYARTYITRASFKQPKLAKKSLSKTVQIKRQGEFLYGVSPCLAAMQANRRKIHKIYVKPGTSDKKGASKRSALNNVWEFAENRKIDVVRVDKNTLEILSGKKPHQGIVMDVSPLNFKRMEIADSKISSATRVGTPVWLVLDEVQDPMNLGAILRCAYFLGVDRVITTAKKCCPLSPAVSKASSGAMELMPVFSTQDVGEFLITAAQQGWRVLGTYSSTSEHGSEEAGGGVPVIKCSEYAVREPTILALGNEGYGLRGCIRKACSAMLTVAPFRPLPQGFDSLNVAVAAGILLHTIQNNKKSASSKI